MSADTPAPVSWSPLKTGLAVVVALAVMLGLWLNVEPEETVEPERYTVVKGDTLSAISKQYGVSVDQLRGWNGIEGDLIEVGQELIVWTELGGGRLTEAPAGRSRSGSVRSARGGVSPLPSPADALLPLVMPPERSCLAGPADSDLGSPEDEPSFAASGGLDAQQVRVSMNAFLPRLGRCISDGEWPTGVVDTEITVACTGRVAAVHVTDGGGLDASLVDCVSDTLLYAPFPAHDMPDGFTFRFPIRFSS